MVYKMAKIPKKLIERLSKEFGVKRISKDAKDVIEEHLLNQLERINKLAIKNSRHFGRKLITADDIRFGIRYVR